MGPVDVREYAADTAVGYSAGPWAVIVWFKLLCTDGAVRKTKRVAAAADTFFSHGCTVSVRNRTVSGFAHLIEGPDGPIYCFTATGRNRALLPGSLTSIGCEGPAVALPAGHPVMITCGLCGGRARPRSGVDTGGPGTSRAKDGPSWTTFCDSCAERCRALYAFPMIAAGWIKPAEILRGERYFTGPCGRPHNRLTGRPSGHDCGRIDPRAEVERARYGDETRARQIEDFSAQYPADLARYDAQNVEVKHYGE